MALNGDEILDIATAAIQGLPNPVEGKEAQESYDRLVKELEAEPDAVWDVPKIAR